MLCEGYDAIDDALCQLKEAWGNVEFNGRDYYPQGPDAFERARKQRAEMADHIRHVFEYINDIREHLYNE